MPDKKAGREVYYEDHQLRLTAVALCSAVETYEKIITNAVAATPELKRAVQTSIKELCSAISDSISKH